MLDGNSVWPCVVLEVDDEEDALVHTFWGDVSDVLVVEIYR